jgi:hypothetical protein
MEAEIATTVVQIIPFGEGGAEIGMTRAEIHEHMDYLRSNFDVITTTILQLVFAWLVGMFFVAHRLSRLQLFVATIFFAVFYFQAWSHYFIIIDEYELWHSFAWPADYAHYGFTPSPDRTWMIKAVHYLNFTGPLWDALPLIMFAGSIWWASSCRRNQPKELGSPL